MKRKRVTITQLAQLAGVSIGTVDRALHDRPGIHEGTKKRILALAAEHGYRPNRIGQTLSRRKPIDIGVITLPATPFQQDVIDAARKVSEELKDFNLTTHIHSIAHLDGRLVADKVEAFVEQGVDGIALEGMEDDRLYAAVDKAVEAGIAVVTFNSDMPGSRRLCFVGQDLFKSGCVGADLLCRFIGGCGSILVLHGSKMVDAHCRRVDGFLSVVQSQFPEVDVLAIEETLDEEQVAYEKTRAVLDTHPDVRGIYVAAAGNQGAGQVLEEKGLSGKVRLVGNDLIATTEQLIKRGVMDATILQDPDAQGRMPVQILFDLLTLGKKPEGDVFHTRIEIRTRSGL